MSHKQFHPNASSFDKVNALYLASLSEAVYQSLSSLQPLLQKDFQLTHYTPFENVQTDTQAFLAGNDQILVLVFRGTTTWDDWMTNLNVRTVPSAVGHVHSGFNAALDSIWPQVYDAVMSTKGRTQTCWVTGHSLGGALATLAVDRFTEENLQLVDGLYTFGQPRVGNGAFADNFNRKMQKKTFRFVDDEDIVTKIPIPPQYRHIGQELFIDREGRLHRNNTFWSWFQSASESVAIRSSEDAARYQAENPNGIADHSASKYVHCLELSVGQPEASAFMRFLKGI